MYTQTHIYAYAREEKSCARCPGSIAYWWSITMKHSNEGEIMREKEIEQKLVKAVKEKGRICPKLVSPGTNGMPDRMVLLPAGRIIFVEVNAPGQKPRPLQERRHSQLRALGFKVFVLDDPAQIQDIRESMMRSESLQNDTSMCLIQNKGEWCQVKFVPYKYHEYAIQYLTEHKEAMMLLSMGLG